MATLGYAAVTFILLSFTLLVCSRFGKPYVFAFSVGCILASNVTVSKQIDLLGLSTSLGVVIYSLVYLASNICREYGDKQDAWRLAIANLVAQVVFLIYIQLSITIPPDRSVDTASPLIEQLFRTTPRVTIAAMIAAIGAFADILVYAIMKDKWRKGLQNLFTRNIVSTSLGQAVNTGLFFFIAFYGVIENLAQVMLSAMIIKVSLSFIDTPFLAFAHAFRPVEWEKGKSWADQ